MGYNQKYYKRHFDHYRKWENDIGEYIYDRFNFKSILDLGCGVGSYIEGAKLAGCKEILGIELNWDNAQSYFSDNVKSLIIKGDITKDLKLEKKFDCVISFEVGEHIPPDGMNDFIHNLTSYADDYIIMTAAPPGQRGTGHINLVDKKIWIDSIERKGFEHQTYLVAQFGSDWQEFYPERYIIDNLMVFRKKEKIEKIEIVDPIKNEVYDKRENILSFLPNNSICAELGVYSGAFSYQILTHHSPKKLYLIDPYWVKFGKKFWWNGKETWKTFCSAMKIVQKYDNNKCVSFIIDEDISFLNNMENNIFDWVYLDSTHVYFDTLKELDAIAPKIKNNGYICGHDFRYNYKHKHYGVAKAITEWLLENKDYELYLLDNHTQWIIRKITNEKLHNSKSIK